MPLDTSFHPRRRCRPGTPARTGTSTVVSEALCSTEEGALEEVARATPTGGFVALRLAYRPPFDWQALVDFLRLRATPAVESVEGETYRRTIEWGERIGTIEVSPLPAACQLELKIGLSALRGLVGLVARIRRMFDLDADPSAIAAVLGRDPLLAPLVEARPGLRVPGAWDGFELAVRAILGQQVSVRAATTLAGRVAERYGRPLPSPARGLTRLFPTPEALIEADLTAIGLTRSRAASVRSLAGAVAGGTLRLEAGRGLDEAVERLTGIAGVGAWTAQYVALRALGEPDAFPCGDLGLRRALADGGVPASPRALARRSESWSPWRAYAAVHLWTSAASR